MAFKRSLRIWLVTIIIILVAIQFIPVSFTNPPVRNEPNWDSPETRAVAERACFDCHSNETDLPWYANVAPASWLIYSDISEGRKKLNFSEWTMKSEEAEHQREEIQKEISKGKMPPWYYLPLHPEARLSDIEKQMLIEGLQRTVSNSVTELE